MVGCQDCQDAFLARVPAYSLSVAVVTSPDSSFHNLHHILLVPRRSKAAVNRQGWPFSRIHSPKLPDCERTLLADNLVFWCSSPNSHSSSDPIATICSFSEVRFHWSHVFVHNLSLHSLIASSLWSETPVKTSLNNLITVSRHRACKISRSSIRNLASFLNKMRELIFFRY